MTCILIIFYSDIFDEIDKFGFHHANCYSTCIWSGSRKSPEKHGNLYSKLCRSPVDGTDATSRSARCWVCCAIHHDVRKAVFFSHWPNLFWNDLNFLCQLSHNVFSVIKNTWMQKNDRSLFKYFDRNVWPKMTEMSQWKEKSRRERIALNVQFTTNGMCAKNSFFTFENWKARKTLAAMQIIYFNY